MIKVENIHKIYNTGFGSNHVLNNISFTLKKGGKLGILGRNGAGKSTLVRLVSGAEMPTSGTIKRDMSVSWPLAFGGAFQINLTGRDNVKFISRIYKQDFQENLSFVEEFSELGPYLKEPVRSYSSGMRARLAFAISMIIEFDCFLIDEVGAVGDARFHEKCNYELFQKRSDRAMIIISHDASYIRDHCDQYAILHDARFTPYNDFELAYSDYSDMISITKVTAPKKTIATSPTSTLDVAYHAAIGDERFRIFVQRGDWARNKGDWAAAEKEYAAALALHPYERTYWAQHGHVLRQQKKYLEAEISYRNSCVLGMPKLDIRPFLRDAMLHQSTNEQEFPIYSPNKGKLSAQPPSSFHIQILAKTFWELDHIDDEHMLDLMRNYSTIDNLAHFMVSNKKHNIIPQSSDTHPKTVNSRKISQDDSQWIIELCRLSEAELEYDTPTELIEKFSHLDKVLPTIVNAGGFKNWGKTNLYLSQ